MKKTHLQLIFLTALFCATLLSACTYPLETVGKKADKYLAVKADAKADDPGKWQTADVLIEYTIEQTGNTFRPSATVQVKDSVLNSFSGAKYFHVYLSYLDRDNIAISRHLVSPKTDYLKPIEGKLKLLNIPLAPENAVGFTFSYWGQFVTTSLSEDKSANWEIFFTPFQ